MNGQKERQSGIELLKLIAIFFIIIFHITADLTTVNENFSDAYVISIIDATANIKKIVLKCFFLLGRQGNIIFFVCSSWFLLENNKVNGKKVMWMLADVWIINFIFLLIVSIGGWFEFTAEEINSFLLPSTHNLNWYITCYIFLYLIHPQLNLIICNLSQKKLLSICIIMFILYFCVDFINSGHYYYNYLVNFIAVYFIIAYFKTYHPTYDKKRNTLFLIAGLVSSPILVIISNFVTLNTGLFENYTNIWSANNSPFMLITAISLFYLFKDMKFVSKPVNYLSSLTMLIYLFHENHIFKIYIRPNVYVFLYRHFNYSYYILYVIIISVLLFIVATAVSALYKETLGKLVAHYADRMYIWLSEKFGKLITKLAAIK